LFLNLIHDELWQWLTDIPTAYYIAFGAHGPRALPPPGEGWKVAAYTAIGVGVSFVIFATIRHFARPAPDTMNKEYQEATNEYLKVRFSYPTL
jgi:cytochrome c oxidase subunit 4